MVENNIWIKKYFEDEFKSVDPWNFFSSEYEQKKYRRQITFIKDRIFNPDRILEIGCAEGAHTKLLAKEFPETKIIGLDISSIAIKRAKKNVNIDKVEFLNVDIIEHIKKIQDIYFDIIIWSESIYYVGGQKSIIHTYNLFIELINKLKQNGILCTTNIIDQLDSPETPLTKRPIMECYFSLLSSIIKPINRSIYFEYKIESNLCHEYQIWLFEKTDTKFLI